MEKKYCSYEDDFTEFTRAQKKFLWFLFAFAVILISFFIFKDKVYASTQFENQLSTNDYANCNAFNMGAITGCSQSFTPSSTHTITTVNLKLASDTDNATCDKPV